LGLG
jgi:hypothetical protein